MGEKLIAIETLRNYPGNLRVILRATTDALLLLNSAYYLFYLYRLDFIYCSTLHPLALKSSTTLRTFSFLQWYLFHPVGFLFRNTPSPMANMAFFSSTSLPDILFLSPFLEKLL